MTGKLIERMQLKNLGGNNFEGENLEIGTAAIYGGHVLAQALLAAYQTVPSDRFVHSMHGYFLIPGNLKEPIHYQVDVIRDGGSFSTRRVLASQSSGTIFIMAASFQVEEIAYDRHMEAPKVEGPGELMSFDDIKKHLYASLPPSIQRLLDIDFPFEFKPVELSNPMMPGKFPPERRIWFRLRDSVEVDRRTQEALLAYVSDYNLLSTAILPVEEASFGNTMMASIDHAMWFYRPFDINEWLLYDLHTPNTSGARGFVRGNIFNEKGVLVASASQEGLVRPKKPKT
jgi:acyl-CoA thioesterase II